MRMIIRVREATIEMDVDGARFEGHKEGAFVKIFAGGGTIITEPMPPNEAKKFAESINGRCDGLVKLACDKMNSRI